tara:strand:+ start:869 stop:1288 length:420 start_codon:yes stop_codon:yes gene_type:complete
MNIKKTVFNRLNHRKQELSKKVDLGLIDEFNYDFSYLEDQSGLLYYLAYEWHDEAFEEYRQAWMKLNDEYTHNGSSVLRYMDIEKDEVILQEIARKAEELGLSVNQVYPEYDEHLRIIQEVKEADQKYIRNEQEFRDWS